MWDVLHCALSLSLSLCSSKHSAALACCISFTQNGVKIIIIIIGLYEISLVRSANKGLKQGAVKKGSNTLLL